MLKSVFIIFRISVKYKFVVFVVFILSFHLLQYSKTHLKYVVNRQQLLLAKQYRQHTVSKGGFFQDLIIWDGRNSFTSVVK